MSQYLYPHFTEEKAGALRGDGWPVGRRQNRAWPWCFVLVCRAFMAWKMGTGWPIDHHLLSRPGVPLGCGQDPGLLGFQQTIHSWALCPEL